MRKQSIAGFMAAGMAALMLAGCSTQSTQETTAASETGAETKAESEASEAESEARDEAGGTLRVVATSEDYVTLFDKFTQETGIETELLSMSSGEVLSKELRWPICGSEAESMPSWEPRRTDFSSR